MCQARGLHRDARRQGRTRRYPRRDILFRIAFKRFSRDGSANRRSHHAEETFGHAGARSTRQGAVFEHHRRRRGRAVKRGDPIKKKNLSERRVREARDKGLYSSITDDGAGGLSGSVGEMARESGGALVDLEKVPLKYPGLAPWQG